MSEPDSPTRRHYRVTGAGREGSTTARSGNAGLKEGTP
jgi:hypothetical protein